MDKVITESDIALRSLAHYIDKEVMRLLMQSQTLPDDLRQRPNIKSSADLKINFDKDGITQQVKFAITINLSEDTNG